MRNLALGVAALAASLGGCGTTDDGKSGSGPAGSAGASGGSPAAGGNTSTGGAHGPLPGGGEAAVSGSRADGGSGAADTSCGGGSPLEAPAFTACPAAEPTGPPATALAAVNELRARMGLGCMSLVAEINTSAQKHCDYYQQNLDEPACIKNAHEEVDSCAGFVAKSFGTRMTNAGYTGSPRAEVMAFSGDPAKAIAQWINSVYHRTPLLSPWLADMGYGMTDECDVIDMGAGPKASDDLSAVYPYPGQVGVPRDFDGSHEGPTPPQPPSAWPSASPVHLYVKGFTPASHEVFVQGTCEPLPHQWLPDKEQYILYVDQPYAKQTEYRVLIRGSKAGEPLEFDWSFTSAD